MSNEQDDFNAELDAMFFEERKSKSEKKVHGNDPVYVVINPPGIGGNTAYLITTDYFGGLDHATENGSFATLPQYAVRFATARDAIAFAETHGWIVMNKKDSNTLIDVNARIKEIKEGHHWNFPHRVKIPSNGMKHYCCIVKYGRDGTNIRVVMVVVQSDCPITSNRDLIQEPPIVGRVTSLAKGFKMAEPGYPVAFIIAMAQEVEAAMRRRSFPNPNLEIPDIFVTNLMQTDLPEETLGTHFLGEIVYSFSI
jgi:hypothetical protein